VLVRCDRFSYMAGGMLPAGHTVGGTAAKPTKAMISKAVPCFRMLLPEACSKCDLRATNHGTPAASWEHASGNSIQKVAPRTPASISFVPGRGAWGIILGLCAMLFNWFGKESGIDVW